MVASPLRLALAGVLVSALAIGCGPPAGNVVAPSQKDDGAARVTRFQAVEDDVLHVMAAIDRRVARRAHLDPREEDLRHLTMGALLAEDPTLAVIDGAIDPFSFEARARGLASVKATLATAPGELPPGGTGPLSAPALERELLVRLVAEEAIRLEEERTLPRSASALVRAMVETWQVPASQQHAAERDRWLSRRLRELSASVSGTSATGAPLDVVRARELDDALDALEHAAESSGLTHSTAELVKLRELLEGLATRPAAGLTSEWSAVARRLETHLGYALAPDGLERRLDVAERTLRAAATRAAEAARLDGDALAAHAAPLVFAAGPCAVAVPGSRVRSMAPSPERAAACRLRQSTSAATDDASRAYALVAMHDHVVVAQWALDVARGSATIAQATGRHRPLSRPGPDVAARWERVALARPTAAIGGGLAAEVLYGAGDPGPRARAWSELGEVPLDIAERELTRMLAATATK
jgi:hypothetical protein